MKARTKLRIIGGLILSVAACVTPAPASDTASGWTEWASAADAGFDAEALDAIRKSADEGQSAAVMAIYRGNVVAAWGDVSRKLELHSVRKSLYAALWGIAVDRGIADVEMTLAELGVDDLHPLTDDEKKARIVDLLHARSGVYHTSAYAPSDAREGLPERGSHAPDTFWYYNNWDFNVAGVLLERVAKKPMGELFDEWIAKPIGMEDFESEDVYRVLEPGQSTFPALTFRMSTRDLARFGQLWLARGEWNGKQVIPAGWVDRASKPASDFGDGSGYAMMWWTREAGSIPADRYPNATKYRFIQGQGTGGQSLFVIPERDMVIVHRGDTDHGREIGGRDIWTMVDRILGAQNREPSEGGSLVAMTPVPFESQLPELEWPEAIVLTDEQLAGLVGEYELGPARLRIFLHEGRLFGFMPGEGEGELFAVSPDDFYIRVDPTTRIRFRRDENGKAIEIIATIQGREMVAKRVPVEAE